MAEGTKRLSVCSSEAESSLHKEEEILSVCAPLKTKLPWRREQTGLHAAFGLINGGYLTTADGGSVVTACFQRSIIVDIIQMLC